MKKKNNPTTYSDIITVLVELKAKYPTFNMGRHLSTALEDYNDLWGVNDKEILQSLIIYKDSMEIDVPHETGQAELDRIIQDGLNLSYALEDDEDINLDGE